MTLKDDYDNDYESDSENLTTLNSYSFCVHTH